MIKQLIFFFFLIFSSLKGIAQDPLQIPPFEIIDEERNYFYEEIVNLDSTFNRRKIYQSFKNYLLSHYLSESNILQLDDSANYILIARVYTGLPESGQFIQVYNDKIHYTITIKIKDGKYNYRLDNFIHTFTIKKYQSGTQYSSGHSEITNYEFKLNNYNPDKKKGKRMKKATIEELNIVHKHVTKEIANLKKTTTKITNNGDW